METFYFSVFFAEIFGIFPRICLQFLHPKSYSLNCYRWSNYKRAYNILFATLTLRNHDFSSPRYPHKSTKKDDEELFDQLLTWKWIFCIYYLRVEFHFLDSNPIFAVEMSEFWRTRCQNIYLIWPYSNFYALFCPL